MEQVSPAGALWTDANHTVLRGHPGTEAARATLHAALAAAIGTLVLGLPAYVETATGQWFRRRVDLCDLPGCQHGDPSRVISPRSLEDEQSEGIADVSFRLILEQHDSGADITTRLDRKRGETPSLDRPQQALHFCHGRRTVRNPHRC